MHYANDPDPIYLEYTRHVLSSERTKELSVAPDKLASSNANWNWNYYAIHSGLGRYYACSFENQPIFWRNAPAPNARSSDLRKDGKVITFCG